MIGLNQSRISFIYLQLIKTGQVATCAILKLTYDLIEKLLHRGSLFAFPQACEQRKEQQLHNVDVLQVLCEEAQATTSCNFFICWLNPFDFVLFAIVAHTSLHFLGVAFCMAFAVNKAIYTRKLPKCGGFFCTKIAQIRGKSELLFE
ncbi:MAG: hypothetical protein U5L00_07525 [Desulfovermiculus sp.]|nr:hypothetical protein [Desulfovermiculus sp.]